MRLHSLHYLRVLFYSALYAVPFLVQFPQEAIAQFNHYVGETEEEVGLVVHGWNDWLLPLLAIVAATATAVVLVVIHNVAVVEHCEHLVHALDVFDAGVELCVYEENAMEHISVRFNVFCKIIST